MENTKNQYSSVKKKLVAAVAMLLVAAIMVVTSTYAWFTLSTAPEVTGIQTTVGANGNLEIALAQSTSAEGIQSAVGNSYEATSNWLQSNITWGNLIDLSDASYGLSVMMLNPAKLNVTEGTINSISPLQTPNYGYDGRLTSTYGSTFFGKYDGTTGFKNVDGYRGVRAIGSTSQFTPQQSAYNTNKGLISAKIDSALNKINTSLAEKGTAITNLVLAHLNGDSAYDITPLEAVITAFENANKDIEDAYRSYVIICAAKATQGNEENWNTASAAITSADTFEKLCTYATGASIPLPGLDAYKTAKALVTAAKDVYPESGADNADWDTASAVLSKFIDSDHVTLNEKTFTEINSLTDDQKTAFGIDVIANGLTMLLRTDSGAYYSYAQLLGKVESNFTVENANVKGTTVPSLRVTITSGDVVSTTLKAPLNTAVAAVESPEGTVSTTDAYITDKYGYVLDFWFRTNAAGSNLKIQTEAANRIYSDGNNADVMGSGSNATFTSTDTAEFNTDNVKALMDNVKLVFADSTGKILSYAMFDTENATIAGNDVTADIILCDAEGNAKTGDASDVIVDLQQNTPTLISVYVYLDGEKVENKDVANAASSMSGTLNLQFASSAALVPMDYTPLK